MSDTPERQLTEVTQTSETGIMPESGAVGAVQEQSPRPETYLEKLEKHNVQVRADDFTQHVVGDNGQQLTQAIPSAIPTITIPATQEQLLEWSKGADDKAITWLSRYWIRLIKKAVHYGWNLVMPQSHVLPTQQEPQIQTIQQSSQPQSTQTTVPSMNVQQYSPAMKTSEIQNIS